MLEEPDLGCWEIVHTRVGHNKVFGFRHRKTHVIYWMGNGEHVKDFIRIINNRERE